MSDLELDLKRKEKIVSAIRERFSLEQELKIQRRMLACLYQEMLRSLPEKKIQEWQEFEDFKCFWNYFNQVETIVLENPAELCEDNLDDSMSDVHQQIADALGAGSLNEK